MPVSEIDSPLLTIVVNRPFRIRCLSHTSSTSSYNTGVLAVLRSSRKNTFFYWWSLSVRADSMPRLGTDACHRAIGMIQTGTPQCDVALRFGVHRNTISSLWRRFQTTGSGSDRPRFGRPRVTSQRQDQCIRVTHAISSSRLVSLHELFQGCTVYTLGMCATVCVNTTFAPVDPACARFCCHAIVLNVYRGHVPIWGGVWKNGKLYCSQMDLDLVWIIQMVVLWWTAGWASATKMHTFDRDMHLAVGVWWCGVASQPMAGHPGHY